MSLMTSTYTNGGRHTTTAKHRRLPGTKHKGPHWTSAAQCLKPAISNAVLHAGWRSSATAEQVGSEVIDRIFELDARALHVLQFTLGVLVRTSRNSN